MPHRRRLPPKPEMDPDGMWMHDPWTGGETFVRFDQLAEACADEIVNNDTKPSWKSDPTYNLKRKRNAT